MHFGRCVHSVTCIDERKREWDYERSFAPEDLTTGDAAAGIIIAYHICHGIFMLWQQNSLRAHDIRHRVQAES